MKKSELILKYAADHSRMQTTWFALKLLGMDTSEIEDGGPGSGNWGHKGRPGKVGGSGKGGGKQYRGGRSDIRFHGSREDWINGLTGEQQKKAKKYLKEAASLYGDDPSKTNDPQYGLEMLMRKTEPAAKEKALGYMAEARGWDQYANRLIDENLTENDRKIMDELVGKYDSKNVGGMEIPDEGDISQWSKEDLDCWYDLKSKAMGGPVSGKDYPDELQYEAGLKERPKNAINDWTKNLSKEERDETLQILGRMTGIYNLPDLNKVLDDPDTMERVEKKAFENAVGNWQRDRGIKRYLRKKFEAAGLTEHLTQIDETMKNRLTDDEFNRLVRIATYAARRNDSILDSLDYEDQSERLKDFAILNKMFGGADATAEAAEALRKAEEREAEERRIREEQMKAAVEAQRKREEKLQRAREEAERKRKEKLANGESAYTQTGSRMNIQEIEVKRHVTQPDDATIIERVAGPDKTDGSCVSAALAYAANKAGFDVLDFRGGVSRSMFAERSNYQDIVDSPGVRSETIEELSDLRAAKQLLNKMEPGKEYILTTGRHASVVRLTPDGKKQYLELQDGGNLKGWQPFGEKLSEIDYTLRKRFDCKRSHTYHGYKLTSKNYLVDISSLKGCKTFENALKYINTNVDDQQKGAGGSVK